MPSDTPIEEAFLNLVSACWRELALSLRAAGISSKERRSNQIEKLGIEIESPTHVALLEAWEHANCLDATRRSWSVQRAHLKFYSQARAGRGTRSYCVSASFVTLCIEPAASSLSAVAQIAAKLAFARGGSGSIVRVRQCPAFIGRSRPRTGRDGAKMAPLKCGRSSNEGKRLGNTGHGPR
jgi:hypothetical protein